MPGCWRGDTTIFDTAQTNTNLEPGLRDALNGPDGALISLLLGLFGISITGISVLFGGATYLLGCALYQDYKNSIKYRQYENLFTKINSSYLFLNKTQWGKEKFEKSNKSISSLKDITNIENTLSHK